jgi:hypothetical protein
MKKLFTVLLLAYSKIVLCQVSYDTIQSSEICFNQICFNDSIEQVIHIFGKPNGFYKTEPCETENCEPNLKYYIYNNSYIIEILFENYKNIISGIIVKDNTFEIRINDLEFQIGDSIKSEQINKIYPLSFNEMITTYIKNHYYPTKITT